jgi:hypothetical protein
MKLRIATPIVALALLAACGPKQSETERKIAEMEQKIRLAEMERKLAEVKGTGGETAEAEEAAPEPQAAQPAARAGATGSAAPSQVATNTKNIAVNRTDIDKNATNIATNRQDIDANKKAIDTNKQGIATNKDAIATNSAKIEQNRQGVEEAKRMAAAPPTRTIPAGTPISIRTTAQIRSDRSSTGSIFAATLAEPIVINGYTVAERGAEVEGIVTNSDPGGRVKGVATITIGARSIMMADGRRLPIQTQTQTFEANQSRGKDAAKVGIASGVGAAIGAIAGGGRGAAIGAGAGAAGGTGVAMATRGDPARVPAESTIQLALSAPVRVQELKK